MIKDYLPAVKACSIEGAEDPMTLIEVCVPPPQRGAIAFILDLSDSCPSMIVEIEKLCKILCHVPQSWQVWVYALSSNQKLLKYDLCIDSFITTGKTDLSAWLGTRSNTDAFFFRGSFLSPAIETIEATRKTLGLDLVALLILTDGDLTDAHSIEIPDTLKVIGITASTTITTLKSWRRVLGNTPLVPLSNNALDKYLLQITNPFCGPCSLSWRHSQNISMQAQVYNAGTGKLGADVDNKLDVNLALGSVYLLFKSEIAKLMTTHFTLRPMLSQPHITYPILSDSINDEFKQLLSNTACNSSELQADVIIDVAKSEDIFQAAQNNYTQMQALLEKRSPWVTSDGNFKVFLDSQLENVLTDALKKPKWDALLVLAAQRPSEGGIDRLIIIGLNKNNPVVLQNSNLPFWVTSPVKLFYDKNNYCWILQSKSANKQLDYRGQLLDLELGQDEKNWQVIFSGELRC